MEIKNAAHKDKDMDTKLDRIIDSYKMDTPFRVPEGYFAQFNEAIMNRLPEKTEISAIKTVSMWDRTKPLLYIAAMFAGVYFSITLLTNNERFNYLSATQEMEQQTESQWASVQVTEQEFFQFIEDQLSEFRFREMLNHLHLN